MISGMNRSNGVKTGSYGRCNAVSERCSVRAAALAAGVLVGAVGGCRDDRPRAPDHVTLVWFGDEAETREIHPLIASFERLNPGSRVDLISFEAGCYAGRLVAMSRRGRMPDLARISTEHLPRFVEMDVLADISRYVSAAELDEFDAARLVSCCAGDRLHGLPHTSAAVILYTNRDALRRIGVQPPPTPYDSWTPDEFADVARRLQTEGGVPYGWAAVRGPLTLVPFIRMFGGRLLADDLRTPQLDTPPVQEAVRWFVEQHLRGIAPSASRSIAGRPAEALFARGRCGMLVGDSRLARFFEKRPVGFEWGAAYLPNATLAATVTGENLVAFRTPHTEAAVKLLRHLTSSDSMRSYCAATQLLPTRRSLLRENSDYPSHGDVPDAARRQAQLFGRESAAEQLSPAFAAAVQRLCIEADRAIRGGRSDIVTARPPDALTLDQGVSSAIRAAPNGEDARARRRAAR